MLAKIVVPLDGSALGEAALPYAASLARLSGASLTLLHVHRPFVPGDSLEALPQYRFQDIVRFDDLANREAQDREAANLEVLAAHLRQSHGLMVDSCVLSGAFVETLAGYAHASSADLIVMGTHGYVGPWKTWLESNSDAVVRRSSVPVLLVRAEHTARSPLPFPIDFRRMLVPVDGSAFSESIVDFAIELGRSLGLLVTLFRVVTPADAARRDSSGIRSDPAEYLEQLANRFPVTVSVPETRVVEASEVGQALVEEANRGGYDIIAMATHGRGGMRHMLLGSTADEVVRGTTRPILLLRPPGLRSTDKTVSAATASG
jgi:nucleotide-binding universal stress UspA family protein